MHVVLSQPELWLTYGCISLGVIIIFRAFLFRTSFFGRALLCFSAGLALFCFLMWLNFDQLILVLDYDGTNERDKHLLSNQESTIRYYYWYAAAAALALGSVINFVWMLYEKGRRKNIVPPQQARIFSLSMMFGFAMVLLLASLLLT